MNEERQNLKKKLLRNKNFRINSIQTFFYSFFILNNMYNIILFK